MNQLWLKATKFTRESSTSLDFLAFFTYVPWLRPVESFKGWFIGPWRLPQDPDPDSGGTTDIEGWLCTWRIWWPPGGCWDWAAASEFVPTLLVVSEALSNSFIMFHHRFFAVVIFLLVHQLTVLLPKIQRGKLPPLNTLKADFVERKKTCIRKPSWCTFVSNNDENYVLACTYTFFEKKISDVKKNPLLN